MGAMASQITSLTIVYLTVDSGADQRKHQSSASLVFVRGIHRWPVNSPHKGAVTRKMLPFDDVSVGTLSKIYKISLVQITLVYHTWVTPLNSRRIVNRNFKSHVIIVFMWRSSFVSNRLLCITLHVERLWNMNCLITLITMPIKWYPCSSSSHGKENIVLVFHILLTT